MCYVQYRNTQTNNSIVITLLFSSVLVELVGRYYFWYNRNVLNKNYHFGTFWNDKHFEKRTRDLSAREPRHRQWCDEDASEHFSKKYKKKPKITVKHNQNTK